jgi:tripartite-type tricarboxylate transporter receptor subunit TctC
MLRCHQHREGRTRRGEACLAPTGVKQATVALAALFLAIAPARAQDYPSRLIKLLQGFPPGGNVEFVARLVAHEMSKSLGQTVIVEAKPGQAGSLAAETVAGAEPDGYTLLVVSGAHPAAAAVYKRLKYDPLDGLA